jgi:hypothetical protein
MILGRVLRRGFSFSLPSAVGVMGCLTFNGFLWSLESKTNGFIPSITAFSSYFGGFSRDFFIPARRKEERI